MDDGFDNRLTVGDGDAGSTRTGTRSQTKVDGCGSTGDEHELAISKRRDFFDAVRIQVLYSAVRQ